MENQEAIQSGRYDINSLIDLNHDYNNKYKVNQSDVDKANRYVDLIEKTRSEVTPQAGDILIYTDKFGSFFPHAHIEYNCEGVCNICERPYIPFVRPKDIGISCSTSGGAWNDLPAGELKYIGKKEKTFCDWGHCGVCANGAIHFNVEVSVWEYTHPAPPIRRFHY